MSDETTLRGEIAKSKRLRMSIDEMDGGSVIVTTWASFGDKDPVSTRAFTSKEDYSEWFAQNHTKVRVPNGINPLVTEEDNVRHISEPKKRGMWS